MSESKPEDETSTTPDAQAGQAGQDDDRLIPDSALPEDLQPEKNPLAAPPDETEDAAPPGGLGQGDDMGQPG